MSTVLPSWFLILYDPESLPILRSIVIDWP